MEIEYPAMIYKNNRNNVYIANCFTKNIIGFGKTEEDALNNLKESLKTKNADDKVVITAMHGLQIAQNG